MHTMMAHRRPRRHTSLCTVSFAFTNNCIRIINKHIPKHIYAYINIYLYN